MPKPLTFHVLGLPIAVTVKSKNRHLGRAVKFRTVQIRSCVFLLSYKCSLQVSCATSSRNTAARCACSSVKVNRRLFS